MAHQPVMKLCSNRPIEYNFIKGCHCLNSIVLVNGGEIIIILQNDKGIKKEKGIKTHPI